MSLHDCHKIHFVAALKSCDLNIFTFLHLLFVADPVCKGLQPHSQASTPLLLSDCVPTLSLFPVHLLSVTLFVSYPSPPSFTTPGPVCLVF